MIACSSRMETVYGDTDFDLFAAQVPSPLFQRTATAYGDADFDLFAAQVPSPLFQRTATAYLGVLASRDNAASDVLDASALESPRMPPVRRITGQVRRYHSRVIMSSSGSSSSLLTESSLNDDACGICGDEHGDMMYCEGGGGYSCTAAVHAKCLRSRQVFEFYVVCCMCDTTPSILAFIFRVRQKVKGKWRCALCEIARKALLLQRKNNCM